MATLGVTYFLEGFGQAIWGSDVYGIDLGIAKEPMMILQSVFKGGILVSKDDVAAAVGGGGAGGRCWPCSSRRPRPAARCARWPTITWRRSRSAFR